MTQDLLKDGERGRFFRGNLHCHSNRSGGLVEPTEVVAAYREAGYDFLCLSDHFEQDYGWPFRGSYCRITVVDVAGRRAWGNPIWP